MITKRRVGWMVGRDGAVMGMVNLHGTVARTRPRR
jgi:hypothetical protein